MAKQRSKHQKDLYAVYKAQNRAVVNRTKKLTKLLKKSPNNLQIAAALKVVSYRRKTPKTSQWSHSAKSFALLKKSFTKGKGVAVRVPENKMFKLAARAHDGQGNLVWSS